MYATSAVRVPETILEIAECDLLVKMEIAIRDAFQVAGIPEYVSDDVDVESMRTKIVRSVISGAALGLTDPGELRVRALRETFYCCWSTDKLLQSAPSPTQRHCEAAPAP